MIVSIEVPSPPGSAQVSRGSRHIYTKADFDLLVTGDGFGFAGHVRLLVCCVRFRYRSFPRSRLRHRPRCRDSAPCFRFSSVQATAGLHASCQFGGRSTPLSSAVASVSQTSWDRAQCWKPTPAPAAHTAAWSGRVPDYGLQTETDRASDR